MHMIYTELEFCTTKWYSNVQTELHTLQVHVVPDEMLFFSVVQYIFFI